jgi:hypothetical protein
MRMRFVIDFFGLFCVDGLYTYIDYMHIGGSASDPRMPRASNDRKVKAPRRSDVINVRIETTGSKDNFTDKEGQIAMVRNERESYRCVEGGGGGVVGMCVCEGL